MPLAPIFYSPGGTGWSLNEWMWASQHDLEYVAHASIALDIKILYWTVRSIFFGEGAL